MKKPFKILITVMMLSLIISANGQTPSSDCYLCLQKSQATELYRGLHRYEALKKEHKRLQSAFQDADNTISAQLQLIAKQQEKISLADSLITGMEQQAALTAELHAAEINHLEQRLRRRFGLGPVVGFGYVSGASLVPEPGLFIGIGLSYNFIRF